MRGIRLKNFRSFEDTGWIDLRPITVLVGANSSGKSSFLRFFPLLRQTYEESPTSGLLWYGRLVDFGDFSGAVRRGSATREIVVEFRHTELFIHSGEQPVEEIPLTISTSLVDVETKTRTVVSSISGDRVSCCLDLKGADGSGRIVATAGDVTVLDMSLPADLGEWQNTLMPLWRANPPERWFVDLANEIESITGGRVAGVNAGALSNFVSYGDVDRMLNGFPPLGGAELALRRSLQDNPALIEKMRALSLSARLGDVFLRAWSGLAASARNTVYIGPFRASPERFYRPQELPVVHMAPDGANLAMFLRSLPADQLEEFSAFMAQYFGYRVRLHAEGSHLSILLEDRAGVCFNLIDMGYGFSQVLPIIAQCWATASGRRASKRDPLPSVLAFEQPELHLHPFYQALLGDMFVGVLDSVRAARQEDPQSIRLLVETHSQALVNRLGELVEEGKLATEDVSVLLFEKDADTGISTIRHSTFAEDGTLTNWPIGFFAP